MGFLRGDSGGAHYAAADILKKWQVSSGSPTINATGSPYGGPAIALQQNAYVGWTFGSSYNTLIVGARFTLPVGSNAPTGTPILVFADAAQGTQFDVRLGTGGSVQVTRNGTVLATSSAGVIVIGAAYHLQAKVTINDTTGAYAIRLGGAVISGLPDATNVNTKAQSATGANQVRFNGPVSAASTLFSDLWVCDDSGATNNDFMGDVRGLALAATGAGDTTGWTPLSGANYTNVDETIADGDTTYNYTSTPGTEDLYAMADLAVGYVVKAVQLVVEARKDDAGSRSIAITGRRSGTGYTGTTQSLLDTFMFLMQALDVDPTDSGAWTSTRVNDFQVGAKLIS